MKGIRIGLLAGVVAGLVLCLVALHVFLNRPPDQLGLAKPKRQADFLQARQQGFGNANVDLDLFDGSGFLRHGEHDGGSYHGDAKGVAGSYEDANEVLHFATLSYHITGDGPHRPEVAGVEAVARQSPTEGATEFQMARFQVRHTRPIGGNWTLWQRVDEQGKPDGFMVTREDDATGVPIPVAIVNNNGDRGLAAACEVCRLWKEDAGVFTRLAGLVSDYSNDDPHHSAEVFNRTTLWPIDARGRLVTMNDGEQTFGGRFVRGRAGGRMEYHDFAGGRFPFPAPASQNKNGTSELATHTLKLGGLGRGLVATPTAA